jgi:hypothetical protein
MSLPVNLRRVYEKKFIISTITALSCFFIETANPGSKEIQKIQKDIFLKSCDIHINLPDNFRINESTESWFESAYFLKEQPVLFLSGGCKANPGRTSEVSAGDDTVMIHAGSDTSSGIPAKVNFRSWRKNNKIIPGAVLYFATTEKAYYFYLISSDPGINPAELKSSIKRFVNHLSFDKEMKPALSEESYSFRRNLLIGSGILLIFAFLSFLIYKIIKAKKS